MPTLAGRRFFFATANDLRPGLTTFDADVAIDYVLQEMRDDRELTIHQRLPDAPDFGVSARGDVATSPQYFLFRRGKVPKPRAVPQRRGGIKYVVDPTSDCLILRCGGLHKETGALIAGELQLPLDPNRGAVQLFDRFVNDVFRGFERVRMYVLGPDAIAGFQAGQRLVTISVRSPREYDLATES